MHLHQHPVNRLHRAPGRQAQHQVRIRAKFFGNDLRHQMSSGMIGGSNDDFHGAELTTNEQEWTRRKNPRSGFREKAAIFSWIRWRRFPVLLVEFPKQLPEILSQWMQKGVTWHH